LAIQTNEAFSIYFRPQERVCPAILMGVIVQLSRDKPAPTLDYNLSRMARRSAGTCVQHDSSNAWMRLFY